MKILVIIQARMGSTRLPGKILKELNGRALLLRLIDNLKNNNHSAEVVVATSTNKENDCLEEVLREENIRCFRGSENDVLERFVDVIKLEQPDIVVRATADDPLMSSECMDELIDKLVEEDLDYAVMKNLPRGITTEVIKANVLVDLLKRSDLTARDHEHVTIFIYEHPELYNVKYFDAIPKYYAPNVELTIDTQEEFDFVNSLYCHFGEDISLEKVLNYIKVQ